MNRTAGVPGVRASFLLNPSFDRRGLTDKHLSSPIPSSPDKWSPKSLSGFRPNNLGRSVCHPSATPLQSSQQSKIPLNPFRHQLKHKSDEQHYYYGMDPPGLLDEIAEAVAPLQDLPHRVNLYAYLDRDKEFAEMSRWRKRLKDVFENLKSFGVSEKAMPILASWQSEGDRVMIQGLARGYLAAKRAAVEQRKIRQALLYYLKRIAQPPIPAGLLKKIRDDCALALESLNTELGCYEHVLTILRKNGAKLTERTQKTVPKSKPRNPSTARTVRQLHLLLAPVQPSRNARAKVIYQLLKAVDPNHAPDSPSSVRTGYR